MRVYTYFKKYVQKKKKKYVQECKSEIMLIKVVYFPKLSKLESIKYFERIRSNLR